MSTNSTLQYYYFLRTIVMITIMAIFFISCKNESDELVATFDFLNERVHEGHFDVLVNHMDSISTAYLDEITKVENQNLTSIKQIGHRYKLRFTSLLYYYQMRNQPDRARRKLNFFKFLSLNSYPWFDLRRDFTLHREKIRLGERNYVPIVNRVFEDNYLYWIAFRKDKSNKYNFDLMYSLILMESRYKRRFEPSIKAMVPGISKDEMLDGLWAQWELEPFIPYNFDTLDFNRRTLHHLDVPEKLLKK